MISKLFAPALAATLATASPLNLRASFPPVSQSSGFILVANVTDTSKNIFDPPVNGWAVGGVHVGAGQDAAILHPELNSIFFVNGTGQEVSSASTSVNLPPIASTDGEGNAVYTPWGMQFSQSTSNEDEVYIGLNFGLGTRGAGIYPGLRSSYADFFGPYGGSFVVCNESQPAIGRPQYPVREELGSIPDNCVTIRLLAQCAELPDLGGAVDDLNIIVEPVKCYEDVSAIDWSQY